ISNHRFIVIACSYCAEYNQVYKMIKKSRRYKAYVRRGRAYNGSSVLVSSLDYIIREQRRLKAKEKEAEALL
ncbi:hypothetical protein MYCTH_2039926, partial [Thermothelomyces thermophilus ATCC 42464]